MRHGKDPHEPGEILQVMPWPGFGKMNLWRQDKGQKDCATAFVRAVENGGESPIPLDELIEVARVSIGAAGC